MNRKALFGAACAVVVVAFIVGAKVYKGKRAEQLSFLAQENAQTFVRPHSPVLGAENAKVFVVKFTDPACETCAAFSQFMKEGMEYHSGRIKLVIRYAPFHEGADGVVKLLEAAKRQGKFWETLETLYAHQHEWTVHHKVDMAKAWSVAKLAGVDVERAKREMDDPQIRAVLEQDLADAKALGVTKTPGFFVNGKPLEPFGAGPLRDLIEAEVAAQYRN